jgi:hypothetical protein
LMNDSANCHLDVFLSTLRNTSSSISPAN